MLRTETIRSALALGLVLAVATALLLVRPASEQINLREGDEIFFLEVALAMADHQDSWLWPNAAATGMDKPPGYLALVATSFSTLGVSTWSARLPSALMIVLAALLVALAGLRLGGPLLALLAGLALLTPPMLYAPRGALTAVTEPALVAAMAAVLVLALRIIAPAPDSERPRWPAIGLGAVLGWMTLLKTAIVILPLAGLGAAVALVSKDERRRLLRAAPWMALALVLTASAWPVTLLVAGEAEYLSGVWLAGGLAKIGAVIGGGGREPLYLLHYTASGLGSVLPVAAVALIWSVLPGRPTTRGARRLAACFVVTTLTLFSVTATQWPWYAVPAFPGLALLVGLAFAEAGQRPKGGLVAVLGAAVALGLLLHQPWIRAFDLLHPEVALLEIPFEPKPGPLLAAWPIGALGLGLALPLVLATTWSRLGAAARHGVAAALLLTVCATSLGNLVRLQWFPEVRAIEPLLTLVDFALAKEARGGEMDTGLNDGYFRFQLAALERQRPEERVRIHVVATDPGGDSPLVVERARPVPPRDEREEFPGTPMELRDGVHFADLEVALAPDEPLLLRLRRTDGGALEAADCLRLIRLGGREPVELTLRFGRLVPDAVPPGVSAEVFCVADRPHYRGRVGPLDEEEAQRSQ